MYGPVKLRGGAVVQGGLNPRTRNYFDHTIPARAPYRAVVVNTEVEDSPTRVSNPARRTSKVLCDVVFVASQIFVARVVVEQKLGVNNGDLWIPRPSTRRVSTGGAVELSRSSLGGSTTSTDPTPLGDLDGDVVLVDFIEGDLHYPVIRGSLEHERSLRSIVEGSGWTEAGAGDERGTAHKDERYSRWGGTEFRINANGDVLIDTVGATSDIVNEAPSSDTGQVRVRLKDNLKFTIEADGTDVLEVFKDGSGVHVHLGEGATESLIKGDAFKALYDAHTHSSPAGGSTGPPALAMDNPVGTHLSQQHKVK